MEPKRLFGQQTVFKMDEALRSAYLGGKLKTMYTVFDINSQAAP